MTRDRIPLLVALVMALGALAALVWPRTAPRPERPAAPALAATEVDDLEPPEVSSELDRRIEATRVHAERSGTWLDWDTVAGLYIARADEGGGLDDLGRAGDALDRAFALAQPGVGPHMRRAILEFRLHRLDECEAMLEQVERYAVVLPDDRRTVTSLRADLAFFRGEYATAREAYELGARDSEAIALFSLARLEWSTGHLDRADELLARADVARGSDRSLEAFLALAHATLARERGRADAAMRHAMRAMSLRPELTERMLLVAELRLEEGELDAASALVERALARDDSPQAHELAARIARARGDEIATEEHRSAATRAIEALFPRFPEAIAGHALLHFLRFEDEARAVEMAEVNARARPFGESRARLALAYLRAGRRQDALREIEAVLSSGWSTAESHAIAAEIFETMRDPRAAGERATASSMSPVAMERVADLRRP